MRSHRLIVVFAAALLLVACGADSQSNDRSRNGDAASTSADRRSGTTTTLPGSARMVMATIDLPRGMSSWAVGDDAIWVAQNEPAEVRRLDRDSGRVTATVDIEAQLQQQVDKEAGAGLDVTVELGQITVSKDAVWVTNTASPSGSVFRIETDELTFTTVSIGCTAGPNLAVSDDAVWVPGTCRPSTVSRIGRDGLTVAGIDVPAGPVGRPVEVAASATAAWILSIGGIGDQPPPPALTRLDPATGTIVATVENPGGLDCFDARYALAVSDDAVWITVGCSRGDTLVRIDPRTLAVTDTISLGKSSLVKRHLAVSQDAVWITDHDGLLRIDPATRTLADTIDFGFEPADVVVNGDELWIDEPPDSETHGPTKLLRLDPRA